MAEPAPRDPAPSRPAEIRKTRQEALAIALGAAFKECGVRYNDRAGLQKLADALGRRLSLRQIVLLEGDEETAGRLIHAPGPLPPAGAATYLSRTPFKPR